MALALGVAIVATRGTDTSNTAAADDAAIRIESSRVEHFHQPASVRVYVRGGTSQDGYVRIWLPAEYLQKVEVQEVSPKPAMIEAAPDRLVYVFRLDDPKRPATITFTFLPSEVGPLLGRIGLVSGEEATFNQFVYP